VETRDEKEIFFLASQMSLDIENKVAIEITRNYHGNARNV